MLGPIQRRSDDFGDITVDVDLPTEELNNWLNYDYKYVRKLEQLAKDSFNRTRSADIIRNDLIHYLQQTLVDGALKLGNPYSGLALIALEDIDWDTVISPFVVEYEGPQYRDVEDEAETLLTEFDRALETIPGELPKQSPIDNAEWSF